VTPPEFFIPEAADSAATWDEYVAALGLKDEDVKALYGINYVHEGNRYEVRVGEARKVFPRKTGPRGGYRPNAGYRDWSSPSGSIVTAIMRAPNVLYVWSLVPSRPWVNPSMVGPGSLEEVISFDD
jgi:hypothetical protein